MLALPALAAGDREGHHDSVADLELLHPSPDLDDFTPELTMLLFGPACDLLSRGEWDNVSDWPPADHLILSVKRGDRGALQMLYERCGSAAYAVARRILSNSADAEDVVQETFLQVWQQAKRFDRRRATVRGWILMIARSRALDRARRVTVHLKREENLDSVEHVLAADDDVCERVLRGQQAEVLRRELDALPSGQRVTVDLSFTEGLSHTEISAALSLPLGTVKTRIRDAMHRIRGNVNGTSPAKPAKPGSEPSPFTHALAHFLASQPRHLTTQGPLRGRRVLLVDDDADTVDLLRAILRAAGLEVATARSSREGLARLAEDWPDLLLADIVMPPIDGYEFVRQACALADSSGRRLVAAAFTALGEEAAPQARAAGFALLIPKPVQPEVLLDTLATLGSG